MLDALDVDAQARQAYAGAGMFVSGGPNGDNGLSGKKLVVDAYGPTVPIGGGAWSGKDFRKVDRIGGMLARELALAAVAEAGAGEAQVTLEYIPGCEGPVHVGVLIDGKPATLERFPVTGAIARDNLGAWRRYVGVATPLVDLARWGHQQAGMPWDSRRIPESSRSRRPDRRPVLNWLTRARRITM